MKAIIGVKLEHRENTATELQKIATQFGCDIKTRIGLHDVHNNVCETSGIILFEVIKNAQEFEAALKGIEGAAVKSMTF